MSESSWTFDEQQTFSFDVVGYQWVTILDVSQYVEIYRATYTLSNVNLFNMTGNAHTIYAMGARNKQVELTTQIAYDSDLFDTCTAVVRDAKTSTVTKGFAYNGDSYKNIGLNIPSWVGGSSEPSWDKRNTNAYYSPSTWNIKAEGKKVEIIDEDNADHSFYLMQFTAGVSYTLKKNKSLSSDNFAAVEVHTFNNSGSAFYHDDRWIPLQPETRQPFFSYGSLLNMESFTKKIRPISDDFYDLGLWANIFYHVYDNYIAVNPLIVSTYQHDDIVQLGLSLLRGTYTPPTVHIQIRAGLYATIDGTIPSSSVIVDSVNIKTNGKEHIYTLNVADILTKLTADYKRGGYVGIYVQTVYAYRDGEIVYTIRHQYACAKLKAKADAPRWTNLEYSENYENLLLFFKNYGEVPPSEKGDTAEDEEKHDGSTGDGSVPASDSDIGLNLLTTTYLLTADQLKAVGNELWQDNFFQNIKLLNNSPIENVLACKIFPTSFTGVTSLLKIGNVSMLDGASVSKLTSPSTLKKTTGQIAIATKFNSFLDLEPYTSIKLWIPFIGFQPLTPSDFMGANISLSFTFDPVTGVLTCRVLRNGSTYAKYSGTCAVDVPITSSNRAQVESAYIQAGLTAIAGVSTGNVGMIANSALNAATAQNHFNTRGNSGGSSGRYDPMTPYLIISRPNAQTELSAYGGTVGYPCNLSKNLNTLNGFTSVHDIHLDDVPCHDSERQKLKQIMQTGFII